MGRKQYVDELAQQKLYETWLKKDHWRLRDEAVPLLAGVDPETGGEDEQLAALWQELAAAVAAGSLRVDNPGAEPSLWTASPRAVYRWVADAGRPVPEAFRNLMEFILQTVKQDPLSAPGDGAETDFYAGNEAILGAALSVLAAWPDRCFTRNGGVDVRRVILLMHEHAGELFGSDGLEYSYERVYDLLQARIKKLVNRES
jgi:hypothetical protein